MKSPGEPTPFLFYIITPKMERQYLTVDSSIRQDKSGKRVFRLQTLAVFEIIMTTSDRFFITSLFIKDKSDSKSTVSTTSQTPTIKF
jgi:hypothetical protein